MSHRTSRIHSALLVMMLAASSAPLACDSGGQEIADGKGEAEGDAQAGDEAKGDATKDDAAKGDEAKGDGARGDANAKAGKGDALAGIEAKVESEVDKELKEAGLAHLFDPSDKEIRKRACEFLTPDMVAQAFDVPAGELEQMKMMGCMYTRRSGDQLTDAKLMMIRVHKTPELATTWFNNATASKTKEQLDAEMDLVKERLKEREELDTKLKKKTANDVADLLKMTGPAEGITYEDVPGIADQARVSGADGALWVRLGNMTFQIQAYQGPDQPKPDFDPKNPRGMAKVAIEAQKNWLAQTHAERKAAATKLAPTIIEALKKA